MTKRLIVLTVIAPALWACGQSPMPNMGTAPSAVSLSAESGSSKASVLYVQGPNSCPSEAPTLNQPNVHGLTVLLTWNEVPSIHDYYLEIDRYDATNVYMHVANLVVDNTGFTKWIIPEDGRYRVRIRTHNSCDALGNWSGYQYFSTGSGHVDAPPPPDEFFLPTGNGGSDGPPSGGGGNGGAGGAGTGNVGDGGTGGAGGGTGGVGDGGTGGAGGIGGGGTGGVGGGTGGGGTGDGGQTGGGSHQCNNGSDGDHNIDGHKDCGVNNGNGQGPNH